MKKWIYLSAVLCGSGLFGITALAEDVSVPAAVNYQGRLTNPEDGKPVKSGIYHLEFRIWDDPESSDPNHLVWGRIFAVHVVTNGLFNVLLTDDAPPVTNPDPRTGDLRKAFSGSPRYLGLTITQGPDGAIHSPEIQPRQQLVSAPYAFHAQTASELGGIPADQYYDESRFDQLGLSDDYARLMGWKSGGQPYGVGLYDFGGRVSISPSDPPPAPPSDTTLLVDGKVKANGPIVPPPGENKGLLFPENIGGGGGDIAGIQYFVYQNTEDCELRIFSNNDPGDKVRIEASGNIELAPGTTLEMKSSPKVEMFGEWGTYSLEKTYRATGDGMLVFYGYHGAVRFYWYDPAGRVISNGDDGRTYWNYYFYHDDSDSIHVCVPLAKGDTIRFEGESDHYPIRWKIRWRPFGKAVLEEVQ